MHILNLCIIQKTHIVVIVVQKIGSFHHGVAIFHVVNRIAGLIAIADRQKKRSDPLFLFFMVWYIIQNYINTCIIYVSYNIQLNYWYVILQSINGKFYKKCKITIDIKVETSYIITIVNDIHRRIIQ